LKTAFRLEKYTFPDASVATPLGEIEALRAGTGVCGGAPPATVEITYGWATREALAISTPATYRTGFMTDLPFWIYIEPVLVPCYLRL
jgi:hypothetical protein